MPKAPKTPVRSPPKPRPLRSTKKKISTPLFLKGDTEDSDDGVLVNRPDEISEPTRKRTAVRGSKAKPTSSVFIDDEADDTDTGAAAVPAGVDRSASAVPDGDASDSPDKYEEEFINDGDPYDGVSDRSNPSSAEQLLKVKLSTSTPLKRKRAIASSAVIDIPSSEEDLEAMADDDSMFKKPSGVKATALPPSLSTRSAVSSRSSPLVSSASASKASLRKKTRMHVENNEDVVGDSVPHSSGNADMAKFMGDWMSVFMKDNLPVMLASLASVPSANSSTDVISNSGGRQIIAAYDPNRNSGMEPPNVKGGRVKYGIWKKYIRDMYVE
ncbi:hypothetical protein C8R44DRAFT_880833 [Mycena epipterygia]|nr:hypothetical protein C8R44DRAFT_880833 [Mycena epipterygia]